MKKSKTAEPKARFCGCADEPLLSKAGDPVYIKEKGVLTLNAKEAMKGTIPVGNIDASHRFVLSKEAEKTLALIR